MRGPGGGRHDGAAGGGGGGGSASGSWAEGREGGAGAARGRGRNAPGVTDGVTRDRGWSARAPPRSLVRPLRAPEPRPALPRRRLEPRDAGLPPPGSLPAGADCASRSAPFRRSPARPGRRRGPGRQPPCQPCDLGPGRTCGRLGAKGVDQDRLGAGPAPTWGGGKSAAGPGQAVRCGDGVPELRGDLRSPGQRLAGLAPLTLRRGTLGLAVFFFLF